MDPVVRRSIAGIAVPLFGIGIAQKAQPVVALVLCGGALLLLLMALAAMVVSSIRELYWRRRYRNTGPEILVSRRDLGGAVIPDERDGPEV